jgi:hypothetical protein
MPSGVPKCVPALPPQGRFQPSRSSRTHFVRECESRLIRGVKRLYWRGCKMTHREGVGVTSPVGHGFPLGRGSVPRVVPSITGDDAEVKRGLAAAVRVSGEGSLFVPSQGVRGGDSLGHAGSHADRAGSVPVRVLRRDARRAPPSGSPNEAARTRPRQEHHREDDSSSGTNRGTYRGERAFLKQERSIAQDSGARST